jgi:hypothetical protein
VVAAAATGAGVEITGAATTGAAAALRALGATGAAAGVEAAGAATTGAAGASSVFLATRFPLEAVEATAEFIILVPVEVFISIKRTMLWDKDTILLNFYRISFNFG